MARQSKGPTSAEMHVLRLSALVEETLKTRGWKEVIEPLWDEAVAGVVGRKTNGIRYKGSFVKARKDDKMVWYNGYLCALEDLWNSVIQFVKDGESIRAKVKERDEVRPEKLMVPLVDDVEEED